MINPAEAKWKVTKVGGIAVVLMVATWVVGMAAAQSNPTSWIGQMISLPFGISIYISLVVMLFTVVGTVSAALGWPFFIKASDT